MNNSEDFRRECEARHVLKMEYDKRMNYYKGVLEKRGQESVNELIAEVKKQRRELAKKQALEMEV